MSTDLSTKLSEIKARAEAFKVYGTDGCRTCDDGRITLFVKSESCLSCRTQMPVQTSDVSDVPALLRLVEVLRRQRDDWILAAQTSKERYRELVNQEDQAALEAMLKENV